MRVKKPNIDEIKVYKRKELKAKIRNIYDVDEEFRILNLGITDPNNAEYLEYRQTINDLIDTYNLETGEIYERGNRD